MIGDGVIAESVISFKITWKNTSDSEQPYWDQNAQRITFHSTDIYPDLLYTKAQGLATYYKYTTIDALTVLMKQINSILNSKLQSNTAKTATEQSSETESISGESEVASQVDETSSIIDNKNAPDDSGKLRAYTVTVYGDKLNLLDGQASSANVRIRHRISANLFRTVNSEVIDNSKKIWLEVSENLGKSRRFELTDFTLTNGVNLLVQILPTVDLILQPGEKTVIPKSEKEEDYIDKIKNLRNIRMNREEDRYARSKRDIDTEIRKTKSVKV